jgi:hypothetical protein
MLLGTATAGLYFSGLDILLILPLIAHRYLWRNTMSHIHEIQIKADNLHRKYFQSDAHNKVYTGISSAFVAQLFKCLTTDIWPWFDPRQRKRTFSLAFVSRPPPGLTQPFIQWVHGVKRGRGVTLTIHPHLAPKSIVSRSYTSSLP